MGRQIAAEWIKARSLRSIWVLIAVAVLGLVAQALDGLITFRDASAGEQTLNALSGSSLTLLVVTLIGVLIAASEYGSKAIVSTYTVTPDRRRVIFAKAIVAVAIAVAVGVLSVPVARLVAAVYFGVGGSGELDASFGTAFLYGYGTILAFAGFAVIGLAIGVLSRSVAVGVAIVFVGIFVVDSLIGSVSVYSEYSLTSISAVLLDPDVHQSRFPRFGPAVALMLLYAGVLTALAVAVERRRDV